VDLLEIMRKLFKCSGIFKIRNKCGWFI